MRKKLSAERSTKVYDFLAAAFDDYAASRVLLINNLLPQGLVLASTSIEKYAKALLAINGNNSRGHLKAAHKNAIKQFCPEAYSLIDEEFLDLCKKGYKIRYKDDLSAGFNLVVAQREFLAELDFTVGSIENNIHIENEAGEQKKRRYAVTQEDGNQLLIKDNYYLNGLEKETFISQENQFVYEVRRQNAHSIIEFHYQAHGPEIHHGFLREGCKTMDGKSFETAFKYKD